MTVDTNVLEGDMERIRRACGGRDVEVAPTSVTLRERGMTSPAENSVVPETGVWSESQWGQFVWGPSPPVFESLVLDESRLGMAVLGGDDSPSRFEAILAIIGDGSFPKPGRRDTLTKGQRRQFRDAMIFEAHAREGRDVLVSNDRKAFIGQDGEKRRRLEAICGTRIVTVDEFCDEVGSLAPHSGRKTAPPLDSPGNRSGENTSTEAPLLPPETA